MTLKKRVSNEENPTDTSLFEQMLNESFGKSDRKLSVGDKVKGEVLSVGKDQVIVSTGTRFDGFVPAAQLLDENGVCKVKAGDFVDLFVTFTKGASIFLSPNPTAHNLAEDLQQAFESGMAVEGKVESVNKGGFQVNVLGKAAFCPMSQMDLGRVENAEDYVGKKFEFKITQFSEGGRNVVISRRKLLEEGQGALLANFQDQRKVGDVVKGTVKRVESFGAFIEIAPGLEGLAHVSELSWTRVASAADVVKPGEAVTATIIRMEHDGKRLKISLSLKDAASDPWNNLGAVQAGRVVGGKVTRCMPFGAFVELAPGLEGLVPLSEMSNTKRVASADEVVKPGDTVSVLVKSVDPAAKRISLSIKGALDEAASATESQDIREWKAAEAARSKSASGGLGDLGAKLQAALEKQKK